MKEVTITITVKKKDWLEAVRAGLKERYGRGSTIPKIKGIGYVQDVPWAVEQLDYDNVKVELEEA